MQTLAAPRTQDSAQTECNCPACPGAGCTCGCQTQAAQNNCACGPQCQCGASCTCARG